METVTRKFENTKAGLTSKDAFTREMASKQYRIVSESLEQGHIKGGEGCCLASLCLPCGFLAGRTPGAIVVTYGSESSKCPKCGQEVIAHTECANCRRLADDHAADAAARNSAARLRLESLSRILRDSFAKDYRFAWSSLVTTFPTPPPQAVPEPPSRPLPLTVRAARSMPSMAKAIPWLGRRHDKWSQDAETQARNWVKSKKDFDLAMAAWEKSKVDFEQKEAIRVEDKRRAYESKEIAQLNEYWRGTIARLNSAARVGRLRFSEVERELRIDCDLPAFDEMPKIEEVSYSARDHRIVEIPIAVERREGLYRDFIAQLVLALIFSLLQSDTADAIHAVLINGRVDATDPATGRQLNPCLISLRAEKGVFMKLNLALADPIRCVAGLGGAISPNPAALVPVSPIGE